MKTTTTGPHKILAAAWNGDLEELQRLFEDGADDAIEAKDESERTPVVLASCNGHVDVVRLLLAKGANVNQVDKHSKTALDYATRYSHIEVVLALLAKGADVWAGCRSHDTA